MALNRTYGFEAELGELTVYNGQAILDLVLSYYLPATSDDYDVQVDGEYLDLYPFQGYTSSFMNVYDSDERNTLVKSYTTQITRNSNNQVINASVADMTFDESGTYYAEIGYVRSGYEVVLRYGPLFVV